MYPVISSTASFLDHLSLMNICWNAQHVLCHLLYTHLKWRKKKTFCAMFVAHWPHQSILSNPERIGLILHHQGENIQPSERHKQEHESAIMLKHKWLAWLRHDSLILKNGWSRWKAGAEPGTSLWGSNIYAPSFFRTPSFSVLFENCENLSHYLLFSQQCLLLSFQCI